MEDGHPFVAKIKASDANGNQAPAAFDWQWYKADGDANYRGGAKAIRVGTNGDIYAIIGRRAALVKFSPQGEQLLLTP